MRAAAVCLREQESEQIVASILEKVLRIGEGRVLKKLARYADQVDALGEDFAAFTDDELREETGELRSR